jgi:CBS domain-containing protein
MNTADIMTKSVSTCNATDSLNHSAQLMWDQRCGCLPVLDQSGRVVGMLTDRDVCMAAYTQGRRLDDITVGIAMSRPVRTCPPTATIEEAEDLMMAHAVRRLVVVDASGQILGLVSIDDIARCGAEWDGAGEIDLERAALALGEISRRKTTTDEDEPELPETDAKDFVLNGLEALKTLRDEIRVDLNLAGKEVRDRWRRLETRLRAAEMRAKETRRGGARSLTALVESARQFRRSLREQPASRQRAGRIQGNPP